MGRWIHTLIIYNIVLIQAVSIDFQYYTEKWITQSSEASLKVRVGAHKKSKSGFQRKNTITTTKNK